MRFLWVTNNIFRYVGYFTKWNVKQRLCKEKIWRTFATESPFAAEELSCVFCFIYFQHNSLSRLSLSQICYQPIVLIWKTAIDSSDNVMSYIQVLHMHKAYQNHILPLIMCIFLLYIFAYIVLYLNYRNTLFKGLILEKFIIFNRCGHTALFYERFYLNLKRSFEEVVLVMG